jgi:glycosyltransferase involved in cell wall biosynthesis
MKNNYSIAVIIPCYRVKAQILTVLEAIPAWVDHIIVVDDACPEQSGIYAQARFPDPRLRLVVHSSNRGVGGAVCSGYRAALETHADIFVKLDGDDQMDVARIADLVRPICNGKADVAKGNRFFHIHALYRMPLRRRIGNLGLTLMVKTASGYWGISDPCNGFLAIHRVAVALLDLDRLDTEYFFECGQLVNLNILRAVIAEVPMPARYQGETSSLRIRTALVQFPFKLARAFVRRMVWRYYVYNVNAVSVFLALGGLLTVGSLVFASYRWYLGAFGGQTQSAGTVALGLFPAIIGVQMLLQAMFLDIIDQPTQPMHTHWDPDDDLLP